MLACMDASAALHKQPRVVEIESVEHFDRLIARAPRSGWHEGEQLPGGPPTGSEQPPKQSGGGQQGGKPSGGRQPSMDGWHFQSVDLTARSRALRSMDPAGAVFLGCD